MAKLLKIILSLIVILVLIVIVLIIALLLLFEPNDFKSEIEAAFKESTGRNIIIEGDLDLSVFPWLGVTTGKLVLNNQPEFSDTVFAEIAAGEIKIKLKSLLSKKIEINRIVLKGLQLNLITKANGDNNWSDISHTEAESSAPQQAPTEPKKETVPAEPSLEQLESSVVAPADQIIPLPETFVIGDFVLEDALITWDDRKNERHIEFRNINLNTENLKFNEPIAIDLSVLIANAKPAITEQLQLSTALIVNEALDEIKLNDFKFESIADSATPSGAKINSKVSANISIDLKQQIITLPDLKLSINDMNLTAALTGENIMDDPQFSGPIAIAEFNLRAWLQQLSIPLPALQDTTTLTALSLQFNYSGNKKMAKLEQLQIKLDDSQLNGHIDINDFNSQTAVFELNVDRVDVDRYLPAKATKKSSPSPKTEPVPVIPLSAAAAVTLLPIKALQDLKTTGQLNVERLLFGGLKMKGVNIKLKAEQGVIEIQQQVKQFYQGQYSGKTKIDRQGNKRLWSLDSKLINVQIAPLLKDINASDRITGTINASTKLKGQGNNIKAIKASLNGSIQAKISQGTIKGFNLKKTLKNPVLLLKKSKKIVLNSNDKTNFSIISATGKVSNGVIKNNDLFAKASKLRLNGKGKINLVSDAVAYKIEAKLVKREATATKPEKIKGLPVTITVAGTLTKPTYDYYIDSNSKLVKKYKAKIEKKKDKVIDKINEKLGKKYGDKANKLFNKFFK